MARLFRLIRHHPLPSGWKSSSLPTAAMARIVFSEQFSHYKVNGDDDNGNDRDYKIEGGLYCDRIPVVPAGAMTVLFTLIPSLTLWSTMLIYTAMPESYTVWDWGPTLWYSDDLMAACLRRNPWQNVTLGPRRQSRHTSQPSRASGHKHGPPPHNPTCLTRICFAIQKYAVFRWEDCMCLVWIFLGLHAG